MFWTLKLSAFAPAAFVWGEFFSFQSIGKKNRNLRSVTYKIATDSKLKKKNHIFYIDKYFV